MYEDQLKINTEDDSSQKDFSGGVAQEETPQSKEEQLNALIQELNQLMQSGRVKEGDETFQQYIAKIREIKQEIDAEKGVEQEEKDFESEEQQLPPQEDTAENSFF